MALPHGAVGWSEFVVFPDHTHLLFNNKQYGLNNNKGTDETAPIVAILDAGQRLHLISKFKVA